MEFTYHYVEIHSNMTGTVTVTITCPENVFLTEGFSPDGDGLNDNFRPLHACDMENYSMTIFNIYGERIYFSKDPLQGWDGKINGVPQGSNTYVWIVEAHDFTGKRFFAKGTVTLIR